MKMKQWKKYLSVVMVMVFAVTMMTGCGAKKADEKTGSNATSNADTKGTGDKPYEVAVQVVNISQNYGELKDVEAAINKITLPAIHCTVKLQVVPISEQATKVSLQVAANEKLDLVETGLTAAPSTLVGQGLLTDITSYISPKLKELAGDLLAAGTINGKVYTYPGILYPGAEVDFFYDKDLADKYKITVPDKITSNQDWENIFKQVKASGMSPKGISLGDGGGASITEFGANIDAVGDNNTLSYGVVEDPENNTTITNFYESQAFADLCKQHYDWMKKGYCVPDSLTNGYSTIDSMSNGASFGFTTSSGVGSNQSYWSNMTHKKLGKSLVRDALLTTGYTNTQSWGVASNSQNPKKAVQLLELMYTNTDLANLLNYGIEGKDYVKANGTKNIITFPNGKDPSKIGYGGDIITWFGDTKQAFQRTPNTDAFFDTIDTYGLNNAKKSKCLGYTFDTSKVTTQLTAVQNVINEYKATLITGNADPSKSIPKFVKDLKHAGIDKIIKENQTQLDTWLKTKK